MNSYNNIVKMKYTSNSEDVVSLLEYIIFEDSVAEDKYLVFKFINNLNQRLKEIRVDVAFLDEEDNVIGKSIIEYGDFSALEHETFIPSAKLSCDFATKKIHVKLLYARFEGVIFENDNFREIDPKKDLKPQQLKPSKKVSDVKATTATTTKKQAEQKVKEDNSKPKKSGYNIKNIYRRNYVKFPKFFNGLIILLTIIATVGLTFIFTKGSKAVSDGNFDYELTSDGSGYNIVNYDGVEDECIIPSKYNSKNIVSIKDGAFNLSLVKKVTYKGNNPLTFESGAFKNCFFLKSINIASDDTTFKTKAISNCFALKEINCPNSTFDTKSISDVRKLDVLNIGKPQGQEQKLKNIFATSKDIVIGSITLNNETTLSETYLDSITVSSLVAPRATYSYGVLSSVNKLNDAEIKHNDSVCYGTDGTIMAYNTTATSLVIPSDVTNLNSEILSSNDTVTTIQYLGNTSNVINTAFLNKFTNLKTLSLADSNSLASCKSNIEVVIPCGTSFSSKFNGCSLKKLTITQGTMSASMLSGVVSEEIVLSKNVVFNQYSLNGTSTTTLTVPNNSNNTFASSYGMFANVNTLIIGEGTSNKINANFIDGYSSANNLSSLNTIIFDPSITSYETNCIKNCCNLTKVEFSKYGSFGSATSVIYNCPSLNNLSLNINGYNGSGSQFLSNGANSLTSLTVYDCSSATNFFGSYESPSEMFPNLTTLALYGSNCPRLNCNGLSRITIGLKDNQFKFTDIFVADNCINNEAYIFFDEASMTLNAGYFQGAPALQIYLVFKACNFNTSLFNQCTPTIRGIQYYKSAGFSNELIQTMNDALYYGGQPILINE